MTTPQSVAKQSFHIFWNKEYVFVAVINRKISKTSLQRENERKTDEILHE